MRRYKRLQWSNNCRIHSPDGVDIIYPELLHVFRSTAAADLNPSSVLLSVCLASCALTKWHVLRIALLSLPSRKLPFRMREQTRDVSAKCRLRSVCRFAGLFLNFVLCRKRGLWGRRCSISRTIRFIWKLWSLSTALFLSLLIDQSTRPQIQPAVK